MTRTIRTIIGGALGIATGVAAFVFLVNGFCGFFAAELGESEWWVPLLTIGIPFIAGLIAGVYDDDWYSAWMIPLATIGAALAVCVLLLIIFVVGVIYTLITTATIMDWLALALIIGLLSGPAYVIIAIFGG